MDKRPPRSKKPRRATTHFIVQLDADDRRSLEWIAKVERLTLSDSVRRMIRRRRNELNQQDGQRAAAE